MDTLHCLNQIIQLSQIKSETTLDGTWPPDCIPELIMLEKDLFDAFENPETLKIHSPVHLPHEDDLGHCVAEFLIIMCGPSTTAPPYSIVEHFAMGLLKYLHRFVLTMKARL